MRCGRIQRAVNERPPPRSPERRPPLSRRAFHEPIGVKQRCDGCSTRLGNHGCRHVGCLPHHHHGPWSEALLGWCRKDTKHRRVDVCVAPSHARVDGRSGRNGTSASAGRGGAALIRPVRVLVEEERAKEGWIPQTAPNCETCRSSWRSSPPAKDRRQTMQRGGKKGV